MSAVNLLQIARTGGSEDGMVEMSNAICEARARSPSGRFLPGLTPSLRNRRKPRDRKVINAMVERLYEMGIVSVMGCFPLRVAVWCANQISDEDLLGDVCKIMENKNDSIH